MCTWRRTQRARLTCWSAERFQRVADGFPAAVGGRDEVDCAGEVIVASADLHFLMTAYGSEELAVDAMKHGADDYIAKGRLQIDELEMRIARALRQQNLEAENANLRQQLESKFGMENIVGESPAIKEVFEMVQQVALTPVTVLLQGKAERARKWWRGRSISSVRGTSGRW